MRTWDSSSSAVLSSVPPESFRDSRALFYSPQSVLRLLDEAKNLFFAQLPLAVAQRASSCFLSREESPTTKEAARGKSCFTLA